MALTARAWIRYVTGALLVVAVAGVVGMAVHRARILTDRGSPIDLRRIIDGGSSDAVNLYSGFEYVERIAGKLIFALDSEKTLGFESGWHEIEGVRLQLFRDDGSPGPVVSCSRASFNIETKDARLEGGVQVSFPDGSILTTDSGVFHASRRWFETESSVTFTDGVTIGEASTAIYSLEQDRLDLGHAVLVDTARGVTLQASEVTYRREDGIVLLTDGASLTTDQLVVEGGRGRVDLDSGESAPNRIAMWDGVEVHGRSPSAPLRSASADRIVAERDAAGGWQVVVDGDASWIEVDLGPGDGFYSRVLRTLQMRAATDIDGLRNLRAEERICLSEVPVAGPPRFAEAQSGTVWFDAGRATDVELDAEVEIRVEGAVARGHRARVAASRGLLMLYGDPTGPARAVVVTDRGRISCDQVHMFDVDRRIEARGRVQGELREIGLMQGDGTDEADQPPLLFACESLDLTDEGASYRLEGTARAWQGTRLLLADDILYLRESESIEARGHVRTVLPGEGPGAGEESSDEGRDDLVVTARALDYAGAERRAVYRGDVRTSGDGHTLAATELVVELDDDGAVETVTATGAVEIVDLATGRRMTGQKAVQKVSEAIISLEGSPVQLTDDKGNVVSGSALTWDRTDGSVAVVGDTETIFFPEESP